jgi:hypothetical protein
MQYNGSSWNRVTSPTVEMINSVAMLSANSGWAVGNNGTILRWNGISWSKVSPSPSTDHLKSIDMVSETDGWAVGDNGLLLHYTGGSWNVAASPTSSNLLSVKMLASNFGWAVGDGGEILFWDGLTWSSVPSPTTRALQSVFMASHDEAWAVTHSGLILHYQAPRPALQLNYSTGIPGSFFNLSGSNFLPGSTVDVKTNGVQISPLSLSSGNEYQGTLSIPIDSNGQFTITLDTTQADPGFYLISTGPAQTKLDLTPSGVLHTKVGSFTTLSIPPHSAFTVQLFLSTIRH